MAKINWNKSSGSGSGTRRGIINGEYDNTGRYTGGKSARKPPLTDNDLVRKRKGRSFKEINEIIRQSNKTRNNPNCHIVSSKSFYGEDVSHKRRKKGKTSEERKKNAGELTKSVEKKKQKL